MLFRHPVQRTSGGHFKLRLSTQERQLLSTLPNQLEQLLEDPASPALRRLFPPAYANESDSEHEEEYSRLMRQDLVEGHREALEVLSRTAGAGELSEDEMWAWMRSLNDLRLVLGTRLDVSEDDDPGKAQTEEHAVYYYLGYLQECVVEAMAGHT